MDNVLVALGVSLLTVVLGMAVTAVRIRQLDKAAVVDVTWGAGFVLVALVSAVVATASDEGEAWRRWLLVALVAVWGGRLAWHVRSRALGDHAGKEDPRYAEMLGGSVSEVGIGTVVRRVLLVQGTAQWFIAIPVALAAYRTVEVWPAVVLGVLVWGVGLFFETVAFLERAGLEVRDVHGLREHYVHTVAGWLENFYAHRDRLVELTDEETYRVWELYLVGGSMAFRDGRMGVDQILMVRPDGPHSLPLVRAF
jgi:hypothetical protein